MQASGNLLDFRLFPCRQVRILLCKSCKPIGAPVFCTCSLSNLCLNIRLILLASQPFITTRKHLRKLRLFICIKFFSVVIIFLLQRFQLFREKFLIFKRNLLRKLRHCSFNYKTQFYDKGNVVFYVAVYRFFISICRNAILTLLKLDLHHNNYYAFNILFCPKKQDEILSLSIH